MADLKNTELTGGQDCILEPLCFPEQQGASDSLAFPDEGYRVSCVLCSHLLPLSEKDQLLKHLLLVHKLVIADVKLVADFPKYLLYWKKRFTEQPVTDFCSVIRTNSEGPAELQENYFLLCDVLPEDRVLREQLQQKRLEDVLEQQQKERDDTRFQRTCMFCNEEFTGNRSGLLNHMAREHSFSIGLPDNIVYCTEFLDTLERKLDNLQCFYCEKIFRDKTTLKDHMRKKQHRRLNAKNQDYDRFYVINYLELGKTWEEIQSDDDRELLEEEDDLLQLRYFRLAVCRDWSDWQARPVRAVCLFCEQQEETMEQIYTHMREAHKFDFHELKTNLSLRFYQQVKLVNYIRRELHHCRCYGCQRKLESKEEVLQHMMEAGHVMQLPEVSHWDQPQYYFPTYENDALLTALSDSESDPEEALRGAEVPVYSEDVSALKALKQTSVLNTLLKDRSGSS